MVKPEWGTKRICHSCGAAFYDLRRSPIVCPKCSTVYDPEAILKSRRSRAPSAEDKVVPAVVEADDEVVAGNEEALEADEDAVVDADDEEDEGVLEDASELGEDDEDMAEVIENLDGDES